jgi:hypothetical protein
MTYGKMGGYLKKHRNRLRSLQRIYSIFGPITTSSVLGLKKSVIIDTSITSIKGVIISLGKEYLVSIPKGEGYRYWSKIWNRKKVVAKAFTNLSFKSMPIVCVEDIPNPGNKKKFLTIPIGWLSMIKKSGCSCSTTIIWSQGCQCGGA